MIKTIAIYILALFVLGCARLEIRKATSSDSEGLRFYRPWPYLWITVNDKGHCVPSITYLPDTSQEYLIIPHSGIGSVTFKPTLKDGWNLTAFDAAVDTKIAETLNAMGGLVGKITPGILKMVPTPKALGPGLYRLVFKDGVVTDLIPVFQLIDQNSQPIACPALIGPVTEEPETKEPKPGQR